MLIESFAQSILRWLRIPQGASVRKEYGKQGTTDESPENEYVDAILGITVDDICIGDEPLSVSYVTNCPEVVVKQLEGICKSFNQIVKWATYDLLESGVSVYDVSLDSDHKLLLLPNLHPLTFYLTKNMQVVAYSEEDNRKSKVNLSDKVVFINFSKRDLVEVEDMSGLSSDIKYQITPAPMQLRNAHKTISGITNAEDSVAKYRNLLRPARWANVDIGTAQGDTQKDTIDSISSAINANSTSLGNGTAFTDFDDNIPVLPNRKGLGKVEIASDIPSANISELADLQYWVGKLGLVMRFPSTYIDFSKPLGETAVSMIRGDIRYSKLCKACGALVCTTINDYVNRSKFSKYEPVFSLASLPSSEDDDVIQALGDHTETAIKINEFVLGDDPAEDPKYKIQRLEMLQDLFSTSTNSPALTKWFLHFREFIESEIIKPDESSSDGGESSGDSDDFGSDSGGDSEFDMGGIDLSTNDDFGAEEAFSDVSPEPSDEGEFIEPQS